MLLVPFASFLLLLPPRVRTLFSFRLRLPRDGRDAVLLSKLPDAFAALGVAPLAVAVASIVTPFGRAGAERFDPRGTLVRRIAEPAFGCFARHVAVATVVRVVALPRRRHPVGPDVFLVRTFAPVLPNLAHGVEGRHGRRDARKLPATVVELFRVAEDGARVADHVAADQRHCVAMVAVRVARTPAVALDARDLDDIRDVGDVDPADIGGAVAVAREVDFPWREREPADVRGSR